MKILILFGPREICQKEQTSHKIYSWAFRFLVTNVFIKMPFKPNVFDNSIIWVLRFVLFGWFFVTLKSWDVIASHILYLNLRRKSTIEHYHKWYRASVICTSTSNATFLFNIDVKDWVPQPASKIQKSLSLSTGKEKLFTTEHNVSLKISVPRKNNLRITQSI